MSWSDSGSGRRLLINTRPRDGTNLRHLGIIQSSTIAATTPDAFGHITPPAYQTYAERRCDIQPLTGREAYYAQQVHPKATHTITMRSGGLTLSHGMRLTIKNTTRVFEFTSIIDEDERHRWLSIMAEEVKPWP